MNALELMWPVPKSSDWARGAFLPGRQRQLKASTCFRSVKKGAMVLGPQKYRVPSCSNRNYVCAGGWCTVSSTRYEVRWRCFCNRALSMTGPFYTQRKSASIFMDFECKDRFLDQQDQKKGWSNYSTRNLEPPNGYGFSFFYRTTRLVAMVLQSS